MKVIVAGYPKTGTKSMNAALTHLGYNVYDYLENVVLLREEYTKIFQRGWTTEDFRKMYENVDAVADKPACLFWDETHKAFPDAKIILTIRDNEEIWCESFLRQYQNSCNLSSNMKYILSPTLRKVLYNIQIPTYSLLIGQKYPHPLSIPRPLNKEMARKMYRKHNAYVVQAAPKDRLLVFNCSEGWEPLCKFLGVSVPSVPFPLRNINASYGEEIREHPINRKIQKEAKLTSWIMFAAIGLILVVTMKFGLRNILETTYKRLKSRMTSFFT